MNSEGQPINLVKEANSRLGIRIESKCEKIGHYFVPAEVWPSATVQKGTAAATETLLASLLLEGGDKTVGLYVPRLDINQSKCFPETMCLELFVRSSGVKREILKAASGHMEASQKAICSSLTQFTTERETLSPDPNKTPKSSKKRSKKVNEQRKDSSDVIRRKWLELQNSFSISFEDQWESLRQDLVQGMKASIELQRCPNCIFCVCVCVFECTIVLIQLTNEMIFTFYKIQENYLICLKTS